MTGRTNAPDAGKCRRAAAHVFVRTGNRLPRGRRESVETERIQCDVLIVGGGTAGCFAALALSGMTREEGTAAGKPGSWEDGAAYLTDGTPVRPCPDAPSIVIVEKANVERSGCLAAGVNALNAYITPGHTPQDYVDYARKDACGIVRGDLLLTECERLNHVTRRLEELGLVILKDEAGAYVSRGWRNLKINGENIKPLLAHAVAQCPNVRVINHANVTDLVCTPDETAPSGRRAVGAVGFSVTEPVAYGFEARAVIVATGGAAGLYRPNNPGFSRHKMWYPPFNTGAGYAMGLRAGAEMTTLENRFIALRCKDTIAPTGTIAQGAHAPQVNALGQNYEKKYGITTPERLWGTAEETLAGRGPCYLHTKGISAEAEQDLFRAYLNMAPSQTLRWIERGSGPAEEDVEVEGTEPYVVGGHTASGFWVDTARETTVAGLYAAGDVAGGAPQKYVTGALAEGELAAESVLARLGEGVGAGSSAGAAAAGAAEPGAGAESTAGAAGAAVVSAVGKGAAAAAVDAALASARASYEHDLATTDAPFTTEQLEEAMQKVMDEYAGGISRGYRFNEEQLSVAAARLVQLQESAAHLAATDTDDLLRVWELRDRLLVARALVAHMAARHETRWHGFCENASFPEADRAWDRYVNSRLAADGSVEVLSRPLVGEGERLDFERAGFERAGFEWAGAPEPGASEPGASEPDFSKPNLSGEVAR